MGAFSKFERDMEVEKISDVTGEIRDFVQQQQSTTDGQAIASNLASLLQRATASSVREVDHVIAELQMLREKLQGDAARMQRELAEYATFSESTFQSMTVISECLRNRFPKSVS